MLHFAEQYKLYNSELVWGTETEMLKHTAYFLQLLNAFIGAEKPVLPVSCRWVKVLTHASPSWDRLVCTGSHDSGQGREV